CEPVLLTWGFRISKRTLKTHLQNFAVISHEPSGFRICKCDRPETAHVRQREPGLPLVGSPCRRSRVEIRLRLSGDDYGTFEAVASMIVVAMSRALHVAQAENRALHRRLLG